jgi:GrpB-like predicted nucleotidyltransferase (UPF0157 family)
VRGRTGAALRTHPDTANAYAQLKKTLARRVGADRAAYGAARTAFIETVLRAAASRAEPE